MAEQIYYSVFTKKGLELLTEAIRNGTKLGITSMAFGDGGGSLPVPNENFTSMVREVHRTQLNSLAPDPNNANWLRAEAIIASATGGFNIRELGLYAGDVLVAYSNYPPTYKPNPSDGTARIMSFRMILQIDNTANFDLVIDPDVVLATIQKVEDAKVELFEKTVNTVSTFADLQALEKWDGRTVKTKSYYAATNFALAQPYKGGATYVYSTVNNAWNIQISSGYVDVFMFGARADYSETTKNGTDDTAAIMAAIDAALAADVYVVHMPQGNYYTTGEINTGGTTASTTIDMWDRGVNGQLKKGVFLKGKGRLVTTIYFEPKNIDSVGVKIERSTGVASRMGLSGVSITPASWTGQAESETKSQLKGIGLELADQCFSTIRDVFIGAFNDGIRLSNNWGFCEFNRFENLHIDYAQNCIHYFHNGGYESFHGNSFEKTMIQLRAGGTGIKLSKSGVVKVETQENPYVYHNKFDINAYGQKDAYIVHSENGTAATCYGTLTVEGDSNFKIDNAVDFFELNGALVNLHHGDPNFFSQDRSIFEKGSNQYDADHSFRFSNQSDWITFSGKYSAFNRTLLSTTKAKSLYQPRIFTKDPDIIQTEDGGLGFVVRGSNITGWDFLSFGTSSGKDRNGYLKHAVPVWNLSGNDGNLTAFYKDIVLIAKTESKKLSVQLSHDYNSLMPQQGDSISLGIGALRYKSLYLTDWDINGSGILPKVTASKNLGSSSTTINNIYTQNAVTVVSDENHKNDISELNETEIACAKACAKLYRRYKLKAAIKEKSETDARYHLGAIAQQIVQCFTDHGLDWTQYGIITYEKWDAIETVEYQAATYDEDGQELTAEIFAIEGREAGEIFMMRYEEFNCFVNAGMNAILTELEERLSKLESA